MAPSAKKLLEQVESWPKEDQDELMEVAREIEARRTGVYVLSDDERRAISKARKSGLVPEEKMRAFWKRHGVV